MKAVLLIDHGSRRAAANEMLHCMANLVQHLSGSDVIVRPAHMELAEPTITQGFDACVAAGATEVIALPYMVSPGRHSIEHIPQMVADAARSHLGVSFRVTAAFGVHEKLAELILERAGLRAQNDDQSLDSFEAALPDAVIRHWPPTSFDRCWHPAGRIGSCGDACRARQTARHSAFATESL